MRMFKTLLAFWFAVISTHSIEALAVSNEAHDAYLLRSVRFYNSFKSVGHLVNLMKAHAPEADKKYLDKILTADDLKQAPPEAAVKGNEIYLTGLKKPIEIVDITSGKFSFDGRGFQVEYNGSLEKSITAMEDAIFPKPIAWIEWILPSANAITSSQKQMLTMSMGLMGIMGLIQCFSQMANGQGKQAMTPPPPPPPQYVQTQYGIQQVQQPQQMSTCGSAMFGLLGLMMAMGINPDDKPQEIKCTVDMNGNRTMVINGMGGSPLTAPYVAAPGKPMMYPPTLIGSQPVATAQLNQFCMNPMALQAANSALQAPYVIPPAPAYAAPAVLPPTGPSTVRVMSVDKNRTPANGEAHFAAPGTR